MYIYLIGHQTKPNKTKPNQMVKVYQKTTKNKGNIITLNRKAMEFFEKTIPETNSPLANNIYINIYIQTVAI